MSSVCYTYNMKIKALIVSVIMALMITFGASAPSHAAVASASAHVQEIGWMSPVTEPNTVGTTGRSLRMEAIRISGGGSYRAHVQNIGWQNWVADGAVAGTTGRSLRMEAIQVQGLECRAHVQDVGWTNWNAPGQTCGSTGMARRLEAVQLRTPAATPTPTPTPTPPPPTGTNLAFTADTGMESTGQAVLNKIGSRNPTVTNIVGDFAYEPNLEAAFCDQVNSRIPGKVAIVAGNHEDIYTGDGTMENYEACLPDEVGAVGTYGRDYYYDVDNARVIMISPDVPLTTGNKTYLSGTAEREWLKSTVRNAKAAGKWTILAMHHPCFSIGVHGCSDTTPTVSELAMGLGVDIVVTGHDHNYMRTHQLRGTVSSPQVIDSDNAYAAQTETSKGSVFVVVGNGGHNPREIGALTPIWKVANGTNSPGGFAFGYGELSVTQNSLTWQHVSATGAVLNDSFTISR